MFSYWSKFPVNNITGSGVMTIYFYIRLTRNPEIVNTAVQLYGDWGKVGIPNLAQMILVKYYYMLLNTRVTAFTVYESLRESQ